MQLARNLAWSTLMSAALLLAAAFGSNATGAHLVDQGGTQVNSHAASTWVLGALAAVFLVNSLALFAWANAQKYAVDRAADPSKSAP
jgi:hypothetical protein